MDSSLRPSNMPTPLKVGFLVATGASIGFILREVARTSSTAMWVVGIGVVVVVCAAALFVLVQRLMRKGKSKQFVKGITPGKVGGGGPAQVRAQREDLRRKFLEGLDKLRDRGIDPYELPWYLVVGESGGGKTELLRRCGAAGAASYGKTDPLQGVGGTLNMNWWFYNRAVILDTAGRLWEDLDNPGSMSEWEEFLKLLVKCRKLTPINGLILVIPATSLLRDRADEIDTKTASVVDQLHHMRNALEIRFPVYVVVSKCDLVPGFREFFEHISQPDLQHQILGWTNRQDIDQPLQLDALVPGENRPDGRGQTFLENELNGLADHIAERRMALLRDPTPAGPSGRRLDDVDGIFAFPDQFRKRVIPSLTQYVTKIFAAGRYDRKPLFLRGVYFTSSMREGSPLDEDLARMLGKSLDEFAAEEQVPREERAYFLTDLFDQKIFREPGLVSRSVAPRKQFRRYRAALAAFAFVGIAVLFGLTVVASRRFKEGIGDDLALWETAADEYWETLPEGHEAHAPAVVPRARGSDDYDYKTSVSVGDRKLTIAAYHQGLAKTLDRDIDPPWLFRAFVNVEKLVNERRQAQDILYNASVVVPLVQAARHRFDDLDADSWTDVSRQVLSFLLRLEVVSPGTDDQPATAFAAADFDALLEHVLGRDTKAWEWYRADEASEALRDLFVSHMNQSALWTDLRLGLTVDDQGRLRNPPVQHGIRTMLAAYCTPAALVKSEPALPAFESLASLAAPLDDAEDALLRVTARMDPGREGWLARVDPDSVEGTAATWQRQYDQFVTCSKEVMQALTQVPGDRTPDLDARYRESVAAAVTKARKHVFDTFLAHVGLGDAAGADDTGRRFAAWIEEQMEARFRESASSFENPNMRDALDRFGTQFLTPVRRSESSPVADVLDERRDAIAAIQTAYDLRRTIYRLTAERLASNSKEIDADTPWSDPASHVAAVRWLEDLAPDAFRVPQAANAGHSLAVIAAGHRNYRKARAMLATAPNRIDDVMNEVARQSGRLPRQPTVAFTLMGTGEFDAHFTVTKAVDVVTAWQSVRNAVQNASPMMAKEELAESVRAADETHRRYIEECANYWLRDVPNQLTVNTFEDWPTARRAVAVTRAWEICTGFEDVCKKISEARGILELVPAEEVPGQWSERLVEADEVIKQVASAAFASQCSSVLRRWAQLPEDSRDARQALLRMEQASFTRDYFVFTPGAGGSLLHRYWRDVSAGLLTALANDSKAAFGPLITELRSYQRWPLNHPAAIPPLTPADLTAAAEALEKVGAQATASTAEARAFSTGDPTIDAILQGLGTVPLPREDREWMRQARAVSGLIPSNTVVQRTCMLTLNPAEAGETYPFNRCWTWAVISQGDRRIAQLNTADTDRITEIVWHPGTALTFEFYLYPEDETPDKRVTIDGPWAPLKMLFPNRRGAVAADNGDYGPGVPVSKGSAAAADTATLWRIPLRLRDPQGHSRELRVTVEFDQQIPVEWPMR